uniref:Polyprotein n=2 Tax=Oryza sativa subsp. japonica TaxID=39947 RepID=Q10BS1_ORYSJ|nr:putative polyprotein [Oryza sativa Japonica Group]ABF99446.1 retrotransposon protein, putative, unclassified [Oryza sativa Japonica Group]
MSSGVGKEVVDASSVVTKGDMKDLLENLLKMGMIGPKSVAGGFEVKLELMPNELRLEGSKNYLSWCRRAQLMLRAKGVDHFLLESCEEPSDKESQAWRTWNTTNSTVVSWLMTSVAPSIGRMIEAIQNAAVVWKTLSNMYSGEGNVMMMVEAQNKVENLKQEGRTVQEYASELQQLWADLDHYDPLQLKHEDDIVIGNKWLQRRRVIHFLKGLNKEFEDRRAAMFHQATLPTMEEAISAMVQEEMRLRLMRGTNPIRSAYIAADNRECYNCGQVGHVSYNCPTSRNIGGRGSIRGGHGGTRGGFRGDRGVFGGNRGGRGGDRGGRVGGRGRGRGVPQANAVKEDGKAVTLIGEQVTQWEEWQKNKTNESSNTTTHFGNFANYAQVGEGTQAQALASTYRHPIDWIIDSGASKHVTGLHNTFTSYTPYIHSETIQIADGTSKPIHVNLLSISSAIDQLKCIVVFDENSCLFQEKGTGRRIGTGVRRDGLWYINHEELGLAAVVGDVEKEISLLHYEGIIHQTTCPGTPPQNGVAERKNRHLLEVARSLMFQMNVPKYLWSEAVMTAAYLINRMPSRILGMKSPAELLLGKREFKVPPKVFGCVCFVRDHRPSVGKLDPHAVKCVFVGYASSQKGYKCWDPIGRRLFVSMDVTFREFEPYYKSKGDLDQFLEEFSTVMEVDSREGERERGDIHEKNVGDKNGEAVVIGSIPCSIDDASKVVEVIEDTQDEDREMVPHEEDGEEGEVVVGTIPCPMEGAERVKQKDVLVYQRRRFDSQGEKRKGLVQSQIEELPHPKCPVPESSQSLSPPASLASLETIGNTSPTLEHVELPLVQRRETRSNAGRPPIRLGFEHLSFMHDIANYITYSHVSPAYKTFIASLQTMPIPKDWKCAKQDPKWKDAMKEELNALVKNKTWELVKLPPEKRAVGCKWVFTVKQTPEGKVDRYKARLVAKGYSQTYGIDYDETFAPVAKMGTVRALVSCAVNFGWPLHQLDVKNAFLHGDLHEEVYMEIPPGFGNSQTVGKVCKLKKSLYGLKQSPRAWFDRFRHAVCDMGYSQCNGDHTVFYKHRGTHITILAVYVDDIVITGDDVEEIRCLKERLGKAFEVKDLGPLRYFLGIEIARSSKGIVLSQRKYVLDLLTDTGMLGCRASTTPIDRNHQLCAQSGDPVDKEAYQRLVGRLIYLCHTRPDISYAVSVVSRYMHDPRTGHLDVVHKILRYLKGTPGKGLWFRKNGHLNVEGYCDADWASSMDDRRSTSGYCVFVGGNLVSWRSKKQAVVARSTAEAEYRAMALSLSEMLWMRSLLTELRVLRSDTVMLHCDNKSAISIANNPVQHDRTKHVEIDRFFIKEKIDSGVLRLEYIKSCEQLADCLTKGLGPSEIQSICNKMGMIDIFCPS